MVARGLDGGVADRQLAAIAETVELARELDVGVWLRGGWAMDFFLGEVTREHLDVDWFAWRDEAPVLVAELVRRGYELLPEPPHDQQLDLARDGVDLSFALLAASKTEPAASKTEPAASKTEPAAGKTEPAAGQTGLAVGRTGGLVVAGGPWAGSPWPDDLLDWPAMTLRGVTCPIVNPRAQVEIKRMMPVWVPGLRRRAKDAADIARLETALQVAG